MKLGVKFSPEFKQKDFDMLVELEKRGVEIKGVELQLLKDSTVEKVQNTIDALKDFKHNFLGIHPPFPSFRKETLPWVEEFKNQATYFVLHAGTKNSYCDLAKEMILEKCFVENIKPSSERGEQVLGSLIETAMVSQNLLVDIAHLLFIHSKGLFWLSPWKQVEAVAPFIKAVHAADKGDGDGAIPINGGSEEYRRMMQAFFTHTPDALFIGEPRGGHFNNNYGHIENATALWKTWLDFKDKGQLR